MANKHKGEMIVEALGEKWTWRLTTNAMIQVEDLAARPFLAMVAEMSTDDASMRTLRLIIWGCMIEAHPDMTLEKAGEIIDDMGGLEGVAETFVTLQERTFKMSEAVESEGEKPAPAVN